MKLITKEIENRFKKIGSQENTELGEQIVVCKLFNPWGRGTWFLTEYDSETQIAFGFASIFGDWNDEWGSISISELQKYNLLKDGFQIERDICFKECKAKEIELIAKQLN